MLADQPGMGRPGRVAGTRELVISGLPFILPYVEKAGVVTILRVMHTSMKWPEKF
jgi:toxin ParE1/3/4